MKCIVCGNDIKEGLTDCPICGSKQMGAPIYNTQQYSNLQHQINNMHVNNNEQVSTPNNYYGYNQPRPMQQQPFSGVKPVYSSYVQNYKSTSGRDIIGLLSNIFGLMYSFSVLFTIFVRMDEFRETMTETLTAQGYGDLLNNHAYIAFSATFVLFIAGAISFFTSLSSRSVRKTTLNTCNFIISLLVIGVGVFGAWFFYNNF